MIWKFLKPSGMKNDSTWTGSQVIWSAGDLLLFSATRSLFELTWTGFCLL